MKFVWHNISDVAFTSPWTTVPHIQDDRPAAPPHEACHLAGSQWKPREGGEIDLTKYK